MIIDRYKNEIYEGEYFTGLIDGKDWRFARLMFIGEKWYGLIGMGNEQIELHRFTEILSNNAKKNKYFEVIGRTFKRIPKPSDKIIEGKKRVSWLSINIAPNEAYHTSMPSDDNLCIYTFGEFAGDRDTSLPSYYRYQAEGDLYSCDGRIILIGNINWLL